MTRRIRKLGFLALHDWTRNRTSLQQAVELVSGSDRRSKDPAWASYGKEEFRRWMIKGGRA